MWTNKREQIGGGDEGGDRAGAQTPQDRSADTTGVERDRGDLAREIWPGALGKSKKSSLVRVQEASTKKDTLGGEGGGGS